MNKLYIWKDVLCDYTCGMAVVLAPNLKEAREILKKKMEEESFYPIQEFKKLPLKVSKPAAFYVWGGG